ncbi:MAG: helix-turn-helix domain-containing protein [Acidimicrobiia bacterium]|nr:helix-turn-helix domain-containing protein [Acidimicrobiia bacterium]
MATRSYRSELREAQAEATRERILDALVEVLADGVETFSIPAVAKRAAVSVGTVYRHFGDKSGLINALLPYAAKRTGTINEEMPTTLDEIEDAVRRVFQHFDRTDEVLRAALASRIGRKSRVEWTGDRLKAMRTAFLGLELGLDEESLDHLSKLALILTTSDVYREFRERLELNSDEAADEVAWAIRTLIRGATL